MGAAAGAIQKLIAPQSASGDCARGSRGLSNAKMVWHQRRSRLAAASAIAKGPR
jgi:hypothetical protein